MFFAFPPQVGDTYYRKSDGKACIIESSSVMSSGLHYWINDCWWNFEELNEYFTKTDPSDSAKLKVWAKENGFLWKD